MNLTLMVITHFNSIKVRLKLGTKNYNPFVPLFQFHKGTIKTIIFYRAGWCCWDFNSIKVRLKLPQVREIS